VPISGDLAKSPETGTTMEEVYECPDCSIALFGMANLAEHRKNGCLATDRGLKGSTKTYK